MLHAYQSKEIPSRYAINLMWLNRTLDNYQPYLGPFQNEDELKSRLLDKALKWQVANPGAEVNIWFDSQFTSKEALHHTQEVLDKVNHNSRSKIKLRDIREINVVKNNPDALSDMIPIYFRVDLMKMIICLHSIEHDSYEAAIFSDLEVDDLRKNGKRMSKAELYNPEIMKRLSEIGIQLATDSWGKLENQFIQIIKKPEVLTALKISIDICLKRAITHLNYAKNNNIKGILTYLSGAAFLTLVNETLPLVVGLSNNPAYQIKVNAHKLYNTKAGDEWVKYDPVEHNSLPFGNFERAAGDPPLMLSQENQKTSLVLQTEYIQLPRRPEGMVYGRDDMETKVGSSHSVATNELIDRAPTNGNVYQCQYILTPQNNIPRYYPRPE